MPDYHGYSMDFEWDRKYFMPFIQTFCFTCGWIPIALAVLLLYLLFKHSQMYSREFRNTIAIYHSIMMFYDLHHSYLFTPYPLVPMPIFICNGLLCRWNAPTSLLMTFTGIIAGFGCGALSAITFMRLRNILALESKFRFSAGMLRALIGLTTAVYASNAIGMALFAGDDQRKMEILNRSELSWVLERPDALVWGDMLDTPAFYIELNYLSGSLIYGVATFVCVLIYSAVALHREKKRLLNVSSRKVSKDQSNRMLQIQLMGALVTFFIPLTALITTVKFGSPSYNPRVNSLIRVVNIFFFLNNSMVAITLHLVMNRVYQKIIQEQVLKIFGCLRRSNTEATTIVSG